MLGHIRFREAGLFPRLTIGREELEAVRDDLVPNEAAMVARAKGALGVTVFGIRGHSQSQCRPAAKSPDLGVRGFSLAELGNGSFYDGIGRRFATVFDGRGQDARALASDRNQFRL